eukprot:7379036-Prymnesium_polylepis.2
MASVWSCRQCNVERSAEDLQVHPAQGLTGRIRGACGHRDPGEARIVQGGGCRGASWDGQKKWAQAAGGSMKKGVRVAGHSAAAQSAERESAESEKEASSDGFRAGWRRG